MKLSLFILIPILLLEVTTTHAQKPTAADTVEIIRTGKIEFQTHCGACHDIHQERLGPMLASVTKKRPKEWLHRFISNSQEVILSGDQYAQHLYREFKQQVMPSFSEMNPQEIDAILLYIEHESRVRPFDLNLELDQIQNTNDSVQAGKQIFINQCAPCHFIHHEGSYAPALGSVTRRHDLNWLISFIKNSQEVIKDGDPYANQIYEAYDHRIMVAMEFLSESDIRNVLRYIEFASVDPVRIDHQVADAAPASIRNNDDAAAGRTFFGSLLIGLAAVSITTVLIISYALFRHLER